MNTTIRFPHLGLTLNPGKSFTVFGIEIAYYGVIIALGMLAGALVAYREAKKTGQKVDDYIDFTLYTLIAAIIGARIYYVIFEWDYYSAHPLEIFNLRAGGLAIYGGVMASALTLFIFTKVKKLKFWLMADTAVQGLIIGQIIGRWGNFFNREAFGGYTDSLFAMQLPVSEAKGITQELIEHLVTIDGVSYVQVHPTFLYEGTWNMLLFIGICLYKRHKKFDGEIFAIYLMGYGVGRFIIEGLRTDQLVIKALGGIAASQVLSIILIVLAVAFVIYNRVQLKKRTPVTKDGNEQ
ncbi:MAG: prolipoprotein diacylglyceryl transferase [Lachnospiraceae bacterium]